LLTGLTTVTAAMVAGQAAVGPPRGSRVEVGRPGSGHAAVIATFDLAGQAFPQMRSRLVWDFRSGWERQGDASLGRPS
jgi:hypothetical protein